ncbi:peptidylprolyl isomerase [Anaeromyxobacter oryzae]|uniref:peptidylprolyl isomerase n=1 Tax=Anaeromyxobacter oryzae TaxID=2918170 RepID=A0ABM7WVF3_9BACT|nr:peptidylprolyl isomerase [Anaeromyxobacter oryzae]BDG03485.1 peptidylprolyl isomerase [Anaeromyxobacter oryzae]
MLRRFALLGVAASAIAACNPQSGPRKTGPAVAKGNGITITADEFKARLDEQSPFIRARYSSLDRKKEFLDSLIRFEVLAREAEKQGLQNDPDVQLTMKKIMVQKLVQKSFQDPAGAQLPDSELQAYYDQHKADYFRPKKVRVAAVIFNAPEGTPERAKKKELAKKALAKLKVEEKKNTLAFTQIVNEFSEDAASKATAGDLNFKSQDELEKAYGKELADAVFAAKPGDTTPVVETKAGLYIAKVTGQQEEMNRTFEQVKAQIANKLTREKKTKEFDEYLKKLRDQANVQVDEKVLEGVEVAAAPAGMPGMPGMMGGGMPAGHGMGGPMVAPSQPPPAPAAK